MKTFSCVTILVVFIMMAATMVFADTVLQSDNLLLPQSGYIANTVGSSTTFPSVGITLTSVILDDPSSQISPPTGGGTAVSFFDIFTELSLEGLSGGPTTFLVPASPAVVHYTHVYSGGPITQYATELLALDLTGGTLPVGVMLRESPTLASTGGVTIVDLGSQYAIDSFFDVFTELSLDGGQSWTPSSDKLRITTVIPEPTTMGFLAFGGLLLRKKK